MKVSEPMKEHVKKSGLKKRKLVNNPDVSSSTYRKKLRAVKKEGVINSLFIGLSADLFRGEDSPEIRVAVFTFYKI